MCFSLGWSWRHRVVYFRAILLNDYNSYLPGRNRPARVQPWLSDRMDFFSMFWSHTETATPCDAPAARGLILGRSPPATALHCCCGHDKPARTHSVGYVDTVTAFVLTGQKMNPFKSAGCCCEPLSSAALLLHGQKEPEASMQRPVCAFAPPQLESLFKGLIL